MSDQEYEPLIDQLIQRHLNDYLEKLGENAKGNNNRLIHLEERTLQMLILCMFMQNRQAHSAKEDAGDGDSSSSKELAAQLDMLIAESKAVFEQTIQVLKE